MKVSLFIILFSTFFQVGIGQDILWTEDVTSDASFTQLESGAIVISDRSGLRLLNHRDGTERWYHQLRFTQDLDYLDQLPYVYFAGDPFAIINSQTGELIAQSDEKTEVLEVHYYWGKKRVLFEMERKNKLHLFNLNLADEARSWSIELGDVRKSTFAFSKRDSSSNPIITRDGHLIYIDKELIKVIDSTGQVIHRIACDKDVVPIDFNESNGVLYVTEKNKSLCFIDIKSGEVVHRRGLSYKNESLDLIDGGTKAVLRKKQTIEVLGAKSGVLILEHAFDESIRDTYLTPDGKAYYILTKHTITELDQENGEVKRSAAFEQEFDFFHAVGDKLFIGKKSKLNVLNQLTLETEYDHAIDLNRVDEYDEFRDKTLLQENTASRMHLLMIDENGKELWSRKYDSQYLRSVDFIRNGILIISDEGMDYISVRTGQSLWEEDIPGSPSYSQVYDKATRSLFVYSDKRLYNVSLRTGELKKFDGKIKFKDFDYDFQQAQMIVSGNRVFLKGSNSVFVVEDMEEVVHETHYKRISSGSSFLKFTNVVVAVVAITTGNASSITTIYGSDGSVVVGSFVDGLNDSAAFADYLEERRRRLQNRGSMANPYVYCKNEKNKRVLRFLDPSTGEEVMEVPMLERDPHYIVDDFDDMLFYIEGERLHAVDLRPSSN